MIGKEGGRPWRSSAAGVGGAAQGELRVRQAPARGGLRTALNLRVIRADIEATVAQHTAQHILRALGAGTLQALVWAGTRARRGWRIAVAAEGLRG